MNIKKLVSPKTKGINVSNERVEALKINEIIDTLNGTNGLGYKVYIANLTQTGTDSPIVVSNGSGANTPFINTLGGSVTTARTNIGRYTLTTASLFGATASKCNIRISLNAGCDYEFFAEWTSTNVISISTLNACTYSDDILLNSSIEIRVYP